MQRLLTLADFGLVLAELLHIVKAVVGMWTSQVWTADLCREIGERRRWWPFWGSAWLHSHILPFLLASSTGNLLLAAELLHLARDKLPVLLVNSLFGLVEVLDLNKPG
jgi:hypothetical protein